MRNTVYLGVSDANFKQSGFQAKLAEADDIATRQRDGRVVHQTAVDIRATLSAEVSQHETASLKVVLDDRMPVIHGLALRS